MDVSRLMDVLKTEYGIENEKQFDEAVRESAGINLGIFTMPLERRQNGTYDSEIRAACQ